MKRPGQRRRVRKRRRRQLKMTKLKPRYLLFVGVALGLLALCFLVVRHSDPSIKGSKTYERRVAEGLRVWNPKAGVDSVSLDSCWVEKLKSGPITFGGLDVLCINGLVLNMPFPEDVEKAEAATGSGESKDGRIERIGGIPRPLLQKAGVPNWKFSGVRVIGLTVNRVVERSLAPVFFAEEMRNRGRSLVLMNCRVYYEGRTNFVRKATLKTEPYPVLAWNGGERRLDDLFPNTKGKMK